MSSSRQFLKEIYSHLFEVFGAQKWWPAETPFEVMVGAILTQNTNWKNVEKALQNLKQSAALQPNAMYQLSTSELELLIQPSGFFRQKAKRLKTFLKYFLEEYEGDVALMKEKSTSALREELLALKGIGPETADSILLYALEKPIFVIDAYTKRILFRHYLALEEDDYESLQDRFHSSFADDHVYFNEYHALLVQVGKNYCRPKNPKCSECPLNAFNWNGGTYQRLSSSME